MLVALMYHRIGYGKRSNSVERIKEHFKFLKQNYRIVKPGQSLEKASLNVLLSFDDASFDFYYYVYPLLKKYRIPALLAVPVKYILEKSEILPEKRLCLFEDEAMQNYQRSAPFCTWEEIQEMQESSYVEIASHGFSHCNLSNNKPLLKQEISVSKAILEARLQKDIHCFVYPYGKYNQEIEQKVKKEYRYSFRIGSCLNFSWKSEHGPLCRLPADAMQNKKGPLSTGPLFRAYTKTYLKSFFAKARVFA